MTHNIQRLAQFILFGFALIAASLLYWQVARAPGLAAREDNPRLVQAELRVRRGRLLDRNGEVLAYSDPQPDPSGLDGVVQRHYPEPDASHTVGYYSLRYGTGGAEAAFDNTLRGQLAPLDRLLHRPQAGYDARLSIDMAAQRVADQALGDRRGAIVVLDTDTGEVMVLVSHPAYDPNTLDEDWDVLALDPDAPLLNRATQGVYALGDLARLVGLTGLLSAGITTPPDPLTTSLDKMLAPLSRSGYLATARQLGFDGAPPFDLPTGPGLLPDFQDQGTPRDLARGLFASAIRITLENIPNSILSEISALGIVSNARIENNQLILNVDDPKKDNNKIINWLIKKGLKVQFVSEDEYSLEDVYLKLIDEEGT